jgi:hypothetical protein
LKRNNAQKASQMRGHAVGEMTDEPIRAKENQNAQERVANIIAGIYKSMT